MSIWILYHRNCPDGFTAAWVAKKALKTEDDFGFVKFKAMSYGDDVPSQIEDGDRVYILDFSFARDVIDKLAKRCSVKILDHHQTSEKILKGLPYAFFDSKKSGAMMTWDYFFPGTEPPQIVKYAQDRDLWTWELNESRAISAAMRLYDYEFAKWDTIHWKLNNDFSGMVRDGEVALLLTHQTVSMMIKNCLWAKIGDYMVPAVNSACFMSEVGNRLLDEYPDAPFSAYFFLTGKGQEHWGLRADGKVNVAQVAERYGGGGHKNAAAFIVGCNTIDVYSSEEMQEFA